jgi:hypothetical protein
MPIARFKIELLVDDTTFNFPVYGKCNIDYPFDGVLFELEVSRAKTVGEVFEQIQGGYVQAYDWIAKSARAYVEENGGTIRYGHCIDELFFERGIRLYDNGTIEFLVGS